MNILGQRANLYCDGVFVTSGVIYKSCNLLHPYILACDKQIDGCEHISFEKLDKNIGDTKYQVRLDRKTMPYEKWLESSLNGALNEIDYIMEYEFNVNSDVADEIRKQWKIKLGGK